MTVEIEQFKDALAHFASGVTVVTTRYEGQPIGVTASAFASLSLQPPLVMVAFAKEMFTHTALQEHGSFAVSILSEEQVGWAMRFAGMLPEYEADRFVGINVETAVTGNPILPDVLAWADCRLWAVYDGGDHSIFIGEVVAAATGKAEAPLLYYDRLWGRHEMLELADDV